MLRLRCEGGRVRMLGHFRVRVFGAGLGRQGVRVKMFEITVEGLGCLG